MITAKNTDTWAVEIRLELDALLRRLDQAEEWFCNPETSIHIAALAEEVERLCQQASSCDEPLNTQALMGKARLRLDEMQTLLGLH